MSLQQNLQKCLETWKNISHLDFCLLTENNDVYVTTGRKRLPARDRLAEFREDSALCIASSSLCMYKIMNRGDCIYLLLVWGNGDSLATIGELAVCQIQSLMEAYAEKNDKNSFMQNLLLGTYTEIDAFNRAKKLHISPSANRAVFVVETRQPKNEHALATIRNIFSARTRDFITALDDSSIIVIRELSSTESYDDLEDIAFMLVDMLGAEAMTQAWVSYSNVAEDLKQLANAYKEARTALEIGKTFYAERNVFGYRRLADQIWQCKFWRTEYGNADAGSDGYYERKQSIHASQSDYARTRVDNHRGCHCRNRPGYQCGAGGGGTDVRKPVFHF